MKATADATEIAEAVKAGKVTARAVTEAALKRIERHNPMLGAFTDVAAERALERKMFGSYEAGFANVQDWLAESRIEIDQARLLVLHTAWLLDQPGEAQSAATRAQISAIKVVAARLQSRVVDRAMQVFGAMGLSPDTPLAQFWTWGRALHLMDGPDEVHLRTVARQELAAARNRMGESSAWFTTPEQMREEPRLR